MKFSAMLWFTRLVGGFRLCANRALGLGHLTGSCLPATTRAWVKVLDFAGGTVVHINAGVAGLMCAIMLGKRSETGPAHNVVLTFIWRSSALGRLVRFQRRLRRDGRHAGRHGNASDPDCNGGRLPSPGCWWNGR